MSDDIAITVSLTKSEIARYNFYHIRWLLVADTLGFVGLMIMTWFAFFDTAQATRDLFGSLLSWGVIILAAGLSQPFILFLQIYVFKAPAMGSQTAARYYRFSDDGIHIESEGKAVLTAWDRVSRVRDIGRLVLVFTGPRLAYVIPKRCFLSNEESRHFSEYLLSKTVIKKTRPEN